MTQSEALSLLKTGTNVFLTGEPGSGKTHTINQYVAWLRKRDIEPAITASTGIAATHIGGMTLHSWSGIGIKAKLTKEDLDKIASNKHIAKRVRRAKILIVDEVSMLPAETLGMIDAICCKIKETSEPFGGIQVVLVGDFFQLPPIVKIETGNDVQVLFVEGSQARFVYDSLAWGRANPTVCYLDEQHRQDDKGFLALLSAIRCNAFGEDHMSCIRSRKIEPHVAPNDAPKLFSHNVDVDRVNSAILAKLPGAPMPFTMSSEGPDVLTAALKKGCLSPETLYLKVGAAVMFTKNNPNEGFVNGTLGVVEEFDKVDGCPIVKTRSSRRIKVEPADWVVEENGKIRALITQLPLRLAWAITVHKSQGMSLDEAVMDLSNVFEFGQGYVALSRVRRLAGLHLLGWNSRAFQVHPDVLARDANFRARSDQAAQALSKIAADEMKAKHECFLRSCGGKVISEDPVGAQKTAASSGFAKIREKHPNAYLPWDKEQDEKLRELFLKGMSITELRKSFSRTRGSIQSRLVKLGLLVDDRKEPRSLLANHSF